MFPKAPKVEVFAPTTLFAGREASIDVVITAEQVTKIDYVDVRTTGHQGWRIGSGKNAITMRARYPELIARLRDEGTLPVGTTRVRTSFKLPADIPPSHSVAPAWAYLELYVRVAIPWWPDGKYKFTLPVRRPPPVEVERKPYAIRSGATTNEPRIELSLASTTLIAGETVVGSCAIFHLDDRKPRDVEVSLVPSFKLHRYGRERQRRGESLGVTVTIPAGGAGTSVPFRFRLPDTMAPTFASFTHDLEWWIVAKSGSFFSKKVEVNVPIEIFDASAQAKSERLVAAPRLTDERITGAFEQFANRHGWQQTVDDHDPEQLVYEREGDSTLQLGYSYRGEQGAFLVGRVMYPSLGLDLDVTPSSRIRELLVKDIEIDLAAWDRAHHVLARSPAQTERYLVAAVPSVMKAIDWFGPLSHWNDDEIVFARAVSSVELADLERAQQTLDELARQLAAAPILPPLGLSVSPDDWGQLAQRLHAKFSPGDLSIHGTLEQRPASVELEFEGEKPVRVWARVGDPHAMVDDQPLTDAEVAELTFAFADPQLVDGVASAALPINVTIDVSQVRELVTALRAVLARRDPNHGPYR